MVGNIKKIMKNLALTQFSLPNCTYVNFKKFTHDALSKNKMLGFL